jgi:hypothetical protein
VALESARSRSSSWRPAKGMTRSSVFIAVMFSRGVSQLGALRSRTTFTTSHFSQECFYCARSAIASPLSSLGSHQQTSNLGVKMGAAELSPVSGVLAKMM